MSRIRTASGPRRRIPTASRAWVEYFQVNAEAGPAIPWHEEISLAAAERRDVARSVATFQLGETGGGSHLLAAAERYAARSGDRVYVEAVRLFIAEEQRHGACLGRWLDAAGLPRLRRHWTNGVFRRVRQLAGLELMLAMLLAAEVSAKVYYAALRKATGSAVLRRLCERILRDEVAHIRFQTQRLALLRRHRHGPALLLTHQAQRWLMRLTALVVWFTHRPVLRRAGLASTDFFRKSEYEAGIALEAMDPRQYVFGRGGATTGDDATARRSSLWRATKADELRRKLRNESIPLPATADK